MTDRLRKFFRIRGKTGFTLDEVVAPVVLVQDLTQGPYQAGVTPAAGEATVTSLAGQAFSFAIILNDKAGSVTPVLGNQFDGRSFSFTWAEIFNIDMPAVDVASLILRVTTRAEIVAAGVPQGASSLVSIQNSDGSQKVPVEIFTFDAAGIGGGTPIWRGSLGDNTQTQGRQQTFENIKPNITIGPSDALVLANTVGAVGGNELQMNLRGFYQEQPS